MSPDAATTARHAREAVEIGRRHGDVDTELRTAILVLCMATRRLRELLNRRWDEVHLDGRPSPGGVVRRIRV
jgi:hypothetical protein